MFNELKSGIGNKGSLSCSSRPVILKFHTVSFLVLSANLHQLGIVSTFFVLFVGICVDEVLSVEFYKVLYFVSDDGCIFLHYVVNFGAAVLEKTFSI